MRGRGIIVEELLFDRHEIEITIDIRIIFWAIRRNPFRILLHHVVILAAAIDVVVVIIVGRPNTGPLRRINRMERTKNRFFTPFSAIES